MRCYLAGVAVLMGLLGAGSACTDQPISLSTVFLRPSAEIVGTPADYNVPYDELSLPVGDGAVVSIWHIKTADPRALVVIVPGSDRNKSRYLPAIPIFVDHGYDLILMDYEGFGESTDAPPALERLTADGFAVVDFARTLHPKVVVFGISIGGPTAVRVAAERDLAAVILEAPAVLEAEVELWLRASGVTDNLWDIANTWVWPQIPDSFDTLKYVRQVAEPKLIMQSSEDEVIPYSSGLLVFWNAPDPKTYFEMRGRHGRMIELEPDLYQQTILSWLDGIVAEP